MMFAADPAETNVRDLRIFGSRDPKASPLADTRLRAMCDVMSRGLDDDGELIGPGVVLGMRWLSAS